VIFILFLLYSAYVMNEHHYNQNRRRKMVKPNECFIIDASFIKFISHPLIDCEKDQLLRCLLMSLLRYC